MIRSTLIMLIAVLFTATMFAANGDPVSETVTYKVDKAQSKIVWQGHKLTGTHTGTIGINSGDLYVKDGKLVGGAFEANMQSLTVTDLEAGKGKEKLEGHLKSGDFFAVDQFKTSTLQITKIATIKKAGEYIITANLTIKGISNEIKFRASINDVDGKMVAKATTKIDRSKYDVRYGSKTFFENIGDKAIYDEFDLEIDLVLAK